MSSYIYILGTDPYENAHRQRSGNGTWSTESSSVNEALTFLFSSLPFPGEVTGRKFFMEGVSLLGIHEEEVIQVWSNEPEVVLRTKKDKRLAKESGLHTGRGTDLGLHMEIKVQDIEKYMTPVRALLAAPSTVEASGRQLSPMGARLIDFEALRGDMRMAMQRDQVNLMRKQWETERIAEDLKTKAAEMQYQLNTLQTYLYGIRQCAVLASGKKGQGRYTVFQNRQFLAEEIALLGNFDRLDFEQIADMDNWLVKSGKIWKFLPYERCILVTRIRKDRLEYNDRILNWINNHHNMQNMIWIRDGENVLHVDVDVDFHNAVFPDKDQFERTLRVCQEYVWSHSFKPSETPTNHFGEPVQRDEMGKLRKKPLNHHDPYCTRVDVKAKFNTLEEWLNSDYYDFTLDKQIREEVMSYLERLNKRQMLFAVLLQGIVDNSKLLDVPPGTDLFNWENVDRYFNLVADYINALPYHGIDSKINPYLNCKMKVGEWLVAYIDESVVIPGRKSSRTFKEHYPMLFQVVGVRDDKPVVNYHATGSRRKPGDGYGFYSRNKHPIRLTLTKSKFMRLPMPPSLAEAILDDRNWKLQNKWAVPLMVNYKTVLEGLKKKQNGLILKWNSEED